MRTLIFIFAVICLGGCQKEDIEPIQPTMHEIKYWCNSDSAFIRYHTPEGAFKHYVYGTWSTTFECDSGSLMLIVTSWVNPMNCGVSVDGEAISTGYMTDHYEFNYTLP